MREIGVADGVHRRVRELQLLARPVGVDEPVDHLGVEDEVLEAAPVHRVRPARRMLLALGGRGDVWALDQLERERPRPLVVAGRAGVALHRRDGVAEQHERVDHRLDAATATLVVAAVLVPEPVEALLELVRGGEVGGVVVGLGLGGGGRGRHESERRQCGRSRVAKGDHGELSGRGTAWGVTSASRESACRASGAHPAITPTSRLSWWPHPNVGCCPHRRGSVKRVASPVT